jgi:multimeric flavodoxin WrbA
MNDMVLCKIFLLEVRNLRVLALLGSPRINRNTDILLGKVIEGLKGHNNKIKKYELVKLRINPCIGCYSCGEKGYCIYNDDMNSLYREFDEADIIILASPLYFNSVSSISKLMIDRCHALWASKFILKKPMINTQKNRIGLLICTAGSRQKEDGFIGAVKVADLFFKAAGTKFVESLLIDDTDNISVANRSDVLEKAYNMGRGLCELGL